MSARRAIKPLPGEDAATVRAVRQYNYEYERRRHLPKMITATMRKLVALEREAARLGVKFSDDELEELDAAAAAGDEVAMLRLKERRRA